MSAIRTLATLASGLVLFPATLASLRGTPVVGREVARSWLEEPAFRSDLAAVYEVAVGRWRAMAEGHADMTR